MYDDDVLIFCKGNSLQIMGSYLVKIKWLLLLKVSSIQALYLWLDNMPWTLWLFSLMEPLLFLF